MAFGPFSPENRTESTLNNSPIAASDQAIVFRLQGRSRYGSPVYKLGKGATFNTVPEGFFDFFTSLFSRGSDVAGDVGLDKTIEDRLAGQIEAGGERAKDEIKTGSPGTVTKWIFWGVALLAVGSVAAMIWKGRKARKAT